MRSSDKIALGAVLCGLAAFLVIPGFLDGFIDLTKKNPYLMSFAKFAVLSTFGECIGLRIVTGVYNKPGFGILPRAIVWGLLGMGIKFAFSIFINGTPYALAELGLPVTPETARSGPFSLKLLVAFATSVSLNSIFAPVFMTLHRITDAHIVANGGTLKGFFTPLDMTRYFQEINWTSLWGFVFKKTLPFFWVPAHTITFLLPSHFQVLFAALLGIALGLILAFANRK